MADQSIQFTIAAQDKATRIAQRTERALAKLQNQHFDATHSRREVEIRRMTAYYARLRNKYEGDARFREQIAKTSAARLAAINKKWEEIEARRARAAGGMFSADNLKAMIPTITAATAALAAMRMAVRSIGLAFARARLEQAAMKGDTVEILKAQLGVRDEIEGMVRGIPLLGSAIASAMRRFGDREGIEQAIKNIEEIRSAVKKSEELAREEHWKTVMQRARLEGASAAEMMRLAASKGQEEQLRTLQALRNELVDAAQERADAEAALQEVEARIRRSRRFGEALATGDPAMAGRVIARNTADERARFDEAQRNYKQLQETFTSIQADYARQSAANAKEAAKNEAELRKTETQKFIDYFRSEEERRIHETRKAGEEIAQIAQKLGFDRTLVERETMNRIEDIRDEGRRRERQAEERALNEKLRRERDYANQVAAIRKKESDMRLQLEEVIFKAGASDYQDALFDLNVKYQKIAADVMNNPALRELAAEVYQIEKAQLEGRFRAQANLPVNTEVQARSARFLTRAQNREAAPQWANEVVKLNAAQVEILKQIAEKTGIEVGSMNWN